MKILYNKVTQLLQPWPAGDADHVVGLEYPLEEFDVIQSPPPDPIPAGYSLRPTQVIDTAAKTVTRSFELVKADPPASAPTMRSFRLACGRSLWTQIAAAIAGITNEDAKWEAQQYVLTSPNVTRNHPIVVQLAASLSPPLTDAQVDAVFSLALKIDAEV